MRFVILAVTLLFLSPVVFAQAKENGIQSIIEEVIDERTTADWRQLRVSIAINGVLLKDVKRGRIQILQAEDNLGNDLKLEEFNEYNKDFSIFETDDYRTDFSIRGTNGNASISITLNLASPPRDATHIKKLKSTLELYIPDLDPKAKIVLTGLSEKLNDKRYGQRRKAFPFRPGEPFPFQKFGVSIGMGFSTFPKFKGGSEPVIYAQILDKDNKVLDVILTDKKGNEIQARSRRSTEDKTDLEYRFHADPAAIADLVVYLKTDMAIKVIPLDFNDIPLP